jgi:hypothetical protein
MDLGYARRVLRHSLVAQSGEPLENEHVSCPDRANDSCSSRINVKGEFVEIATTFTCSMGGSAQAAGKSCSGT